MQLYILRHGKAVDGFPDSERRLSDIGREQVAQTAARHTSLFTENTVVVSSPYIRAQQTADIFAKQVGYTRAIETIEALVPHGQPVNVEKGLYALEADNLVLVSHLPLVADLIDYFCGETGHMKTSSLASITMDYLGCGLGELNWIHHVS